MMLNKYSILIIFIFITSNVPAQYYNKVYLHPFSNSIGLSLEGGISYAKTDFNSNRSDYLGRGMVEYFFNSNNLGTFGLRIYGGLSYIGGKSGVNLTDPNYTSINELKTAIYNIGGGYSYTISLGAVVHPYVFAGLSYIQFYPRVDNNIRIESIINKSFAKDDINYDGELGIRFLLHDNFSFNLSGMVHYNPSDNLDGIWGNEDDDIFYTANVGISYYFNDAKDSDGDGVEDSEDFCPNTLPHYRVDEFGCPLDEDSDGVPDKVDLCPGTPLDVVVDSNGCAADFDNDGVPDNIDNCLYTPKDIEVDEYGCPVDRDKDGIADYLDKCLDTPSGTVVDEFGCPSAIFDSSFKKIVINNFHFAKNRIPMYAFSILDKLTKYMKENPNVKWSIEGHADSISVDCDDNYDVSVSRAKSVYNYFISQGLDTKNFMITGFSHFRPIAENNTETGRKLNRRVEIIKLRP